MSDPVRHLYVHVPFCARRCTYCDFSIAVRSTTPVDEFLRASTAELIACTGTTSLRLDTLYLGGGTPSRLGGDGIAALIDSVRAYGELRAEAEVTVEANPDDISASNAHAWRLAGVNRVSLGAQSFDSSVLEWMHRTHSVQQIDTAVATLRDAGIENVSLDLIFALPRAVSRDWRQDLDRALGLAPNHVSLYGLTVEPRAPLGRGAARGDVVEAPDESYETEFIIAHERLASAGFEHYEVSNFAKPGYRSRHNSAYWSGVPYAAIGPSAHRFDGETRSWNVPHYADWARRAAAGASVEGGSELLDEENRATERVYLGLRTADGLAATDAEFELARPWIAAGWATESDGRIILTPSGWLRLDALAAALTLAQIR